MIASQRRRTSVDSQPARIAAGSTMERSDIATLNVRRPNDNPSKGAANLFAQATASLARSARLQSLGSSSASAQADRLRRHLYPFVVLDIGQGFSSVILIGGVRRTASSFRGVCGCW